MVKKHIQQKQQQKEELFDKTLGRKIDQRLKKQSNGRNEFIFGLSLFGLVGWSVAIPTLIGIAIGVWLDTHFPGPYSWTLMLLFLGVILGSMNAWYWVQQEGQRL